MISKILELITGLDDLERIACKNDPAVLNAYLTKRSVYIPQRPYRFLDPATLTEESIFQQLQQDVDQLSGAEFEPWILDVNGKRHLPVFSNRKRMTTFSSVISQRLNKVFGLGCIQVQLSAVTTQIEVDVVELNPFSKKSWEISMNTGN